MSDLGIPAAPATATSPLGAALSPSAARRVSDGADAVRVAVERTAATVAREPSLGQGTAVTTVRLRPGLACDVEEGAHRFTVGMSAKYGGNEAGPNPGVYGRAALGSCLAIGYAMSAAR